MKGFARRPAPEKPHQTVAGRKVFSYYQSGVKQDNALPATGSSRATGRWRLVPTIVALSVILFSVLFSLTLTTRPSLTIARDQPSYYRNVEEYADAAAQLLGASLLNRTKLTVKTSEVEEKLLEAFPELRAVKLSLPVLGRKPSLTLDIKPPALLVTTATNSYVLDDAGVVVGDVGRLASGYREGLLIIKDDSGLEITAGRQVLPVETVRFIYAVEAQLAAKNIRISSFTLPGSANQLDIRLEDVSYVVITDVGGDARLQIGSYLAVKDNLEGQGLTPTEYIDVRVEEKVFYK